MKADLGGRDIQSEPGERSQQRRECDPEFHPGQFGTDASVNAMTEGEVRGRRPGHLQAVHAVAERRIVVRAGQRAQHEVARLDVLPVDIDVRTREPGEGDLDDRQVPQEFLDRVMNRRRIAIADNGGRIGILQQRDSAECQHARGRR